jgi:hypothetical protein
MDKTNFFLSTMSFNPWVVLATLQLLKKDKKTNLKPILNKTSPEAHKELEFEALGVLGKLVKYLVHLSKRKN